MEGIFTPGLYSLPTVNAAWKALFSQSTTVYNSLQGKKIKREGGGIPFIFFSLVDCCRLLLTVVDCGKSFFHARVTVCRLYLSGVIGRRNHKFPLGNSFDRHGEHFNSIFSLSWADKASYKGKRPEHMTKVQGKYILGAYFRNCHPFHLQEQ